MALILYFLIALIGGAFAVTNILPAIQKPSPIQVETPPPSPSLTPIPTPVPQVKGNIVVPTPYDPIVDCGSDWQKQKGVSQKVKKSVCDTYIDCQMGGGAEARVPSQQFCEELLRQIAGKKQTQSSSPQQNYEEYYNNTLKYFSEIESCYNKAVNEVKSGDVPAMTATVDDCQIINRNARKEIDKLFYAPNLSRVFSNLGSAWGWYGYVLNRMWFLSSDATTPPYDITDELKQEDAAMSTAKGFVDGAKKEWEATNK